MKQKMKVFENLGAERTMKDKDLALLKHFRTNSRQSLTRISKKTKIPISTIYDKLRAYEGNLILKHTSLVDFRQLGFEIRVRLLLAAKKREALKNYLLYHHRINSVFRINNGFDFEVEALFANMEEFKEFLEGIDQFEIQNIKEYFVLDDILREGFMTAEGVI